MLFKAILIVICWNLFGEFSVKSKIAIILFYEILCTKTIFYLLANFLSRKIL